MDILNKIKKAGLVGRGGACFPTWLKWSAVAKAMVDKKDSERKCYIICNASEGEPGVKKDGYILEHFPERVIDGIKIAIDFLLTADSISSAWDRPLRTFRQKSKTRRGAKALRPVVKAYIFINHKYHKKFSKKLIEIINDTPALTRPNQKEPIELFVKPIGSGYIGGEETSAINAIEGKRIEPRLRPPFPTISGLWGYPTLINNVETFYNVSLVAADEYENKRFYTINGDCLWTGVYNLPENYTIERILKKTKNYPKFPFFVQIGGDASGEVLNSKQLRRRVGGAGSITIYSIEKYQPKKLITNWLDFFVNESCGQCTPCREGVYRLIEIIRSPEPNWQLFIELLNNLSETAFCGLGCVVPIPIKSYIKNVLAKMPEGDIKLNGLDKKVICRRYL